MFSANENVLLRQHKKRIVSLVEETIPEHCLDLGVQVMVMEVKCQAPGCVPLETVVLIVFPKLTNKSKSAEDDYLLPGLPQSNGGNFKTKILMPMAAVTRDDVLDALPPQFTGGRRSIAQAALQARDVMLGQITQLYDDAESRQLLAEYLQQQLHEFLLRDCQEPVWGVEYETTLNDGVEDNTKPDDGESSTTIRTDREDDQQQQDLLRNTNKNVIIRRVLDSSETMSTTNAAPVSTTSVLPVNSVAARRRQQTWSRGLESSSATPLQLLSQRQHAPGLRPVGCPCCDPDHPSNVADLYL